MQSSQFALGPIENDSFLGGGAAQPAEDDRESELE